MLHYKMFLVSASACASVCIPAQVSAQAVEPRNTVVDEVVVTAARREQRTVDIPASVQAISDETLEARGVENLDQIGQLSPSVSMTRTGGMINPYIRGVGNRAATPGDENSVSVYVDGVYQMAVYGDYQEINNIERIEVLKGPQGTLSGRNSSGGTINIITPMPSLTEMSGEITGAIGAYNYRKGTAYLAAPIIEGVLSADIAIAANVDDGYFENIFTGEDAGARSFRSIRNKFRFEPTDYLSLVLSSHFGRAEMAKVNRPLDRNTIARADNPAVQLPGDALEVSLNNLPFSKILTSGGSFTATWDLPSIQVVSLTGYEWGRFRGETDSDGTANESQRTYIANQYSNSWTQELRLVSTNSERLKWVVGLFGFWDKSGYSPLYTTRRTAISSYTISKLGTKSYAAFGEATYKLNDQWAVTAGGRYTMEERTKRASLLGGALIDEKADFSAFTPKFSVQYYVTPRTNFYATYAKGFKSGLYNASGGNIPVDPEKLTSYELGVKSRDIPWVVFDAAAYYYDFVDLQFSARAADQTTRLTNAGAAEIFGFETNATFIPTDQLKIDVGLAWVDATYTSFETAQVFYPRITGGVAVGGNVGVIEDASGRPMVKTPPWSGSVGVTYTIPTGFGQADLNLSAAYTDAASWDVSGRITSEAYTLVNARVSFLLDQPGLKVTLWGHNLLDEHYFDSAVASSAGDIVTYARPQDFGVTLAYAF